MNAETETSAITGLVTAAQRGDAEALDELLRRSTARLQRAASFLLRDEDAAQDVVQDTLLKLARNIGSLVEPRAFPSWAHTVLRREALEAIRKQKRIPALNVSIDEIELPAASADPEESLLISDTLEKNLGRLQSDDRRLLRMHYWRDLEVREIAGILGIAVGAVKTRLFRARNRLRDLLCEPDAGLGLPPAAP